MSVPGCVTERLPADAVVEGFVGDRGLYSAFSGTASNVRAHALAAAERRRALLAGSSADVVAEWRANSWWQDYVFETSKNRIGHPQVEFKIGAPGLSDHTGNFGEIHVTLKIDAVAREVASPIDGTLHRIRDIRGPWMIVGVQFEDRLGVEVWDGDPASALDATLARVAALTALLTSLRAP